MRYALVAAVIVSMACGGSLPPTRYYQLAAPRPATPAAELAGDAVIAIETLRVDSPYDDERIVYRTSPYRVDYYDYHRWGSPPGELIADYLERALEQTGRFRAVTRDTTAGAAAIVTGRLIALEEVDVSRQRWVGRVVVELHVTDAATGKMVWSEQLEETQPMTPRSPEGLARAISVAMGRIAGRIAPEVAAAASRRPGTRVVRGM